MIPLNKPLEPDLKKLNIWLNKVHKNNWYSNFGPLHEELTKRLESYLDVDNLLLVNNGTSALQIAGRALGINSVLTTPFSYVATASAFLWQKDEVVFSDIDSKSYNLCSKKAEQSLKNKRHIDAVVATHVYGNPCDVEALDILCKKKNKKLIYDSAHAFGVKYKNESILKYGDASTLSFHATKLFHTLEGGAIIFKNKGDYETARTLISCGYKNGEIKGLGINAKLNEYQAAVGLVNLEKMNSVIAHRRDLFNEYRAQLNGYVQMPQWQDHVNENGAYMPILCKSQGQLHAIQSILTKHQVGSRTYFSPSLDEVFTIGMPMPISRDISTRVLCLPMHFYLEYEQVKLVCDLVKKSLD